MGLPVIEIEDLCFAYDGQPVLSEVNLTVPRGDFLVIIGPNGGGKTTLLKLMLGLLPPSRGCVRLLGGPPAAAVHRVGYVPQNVQINKDFPVSALDVVLMGRLRMGRNWSRYGTADRRAAQEALELMDIWDLRRRKVGELSGGELQRVFIARALAADPEVLFLDEATANVDAQSRQGFYETMKRLNARVTLVAVSHDMLILSSRVKSVACVNQRLHYHGAGEITREMLDQAYRCPVELIAHGVPHRVFPRHEDL